MTPAAVAGLRLRLERKQSAADAATATATSAPTPKIQRPPAARLYCQQP